MKCESIKKNCVLLLLYLALLLFTFILLFPLFFSICYAFYKFDQITMRQGLVIAIKVAAIASLIVWAVTRMFTKPTKLSKVGNWIINNISQFISLYVIVVLFCVSIKNEVVWSFSEIHEVLSLEWSIFGITTTVFFIWNVLMPKNLKEKKPKNQNQATPLDRLKYLQEKRLFYLESSQISNTARLFMLNLIVLILATLCVYLLFDTFELLSQNIVLFSMFLCTELIYDILEDTLKPFIKEQDAVARESKITSTDVELYNEMEEQWEATATAIKAIEKLTTMDNAEKNQIISSLLEEYTKKLSSKTTKDKSEEGGS